MTADRGKTGALVKVQRRRQPSSTRCYYPAMSHAATLTAAPAAPRTYDAAVRALAQAHAAGDDEIVIYSLPDPDAKVVRLVEVSGAFPEAGVDRPVPPNGVERVVPVFPMGPADDFPFRSEVAQVTRDEWDRLRRGDLRLTRDWDLSQAREVRLGE